MNEQSPMTDHKPLSRREARRQRREQRYSNPAHAGSWVVGMILILLGGMFLMNNTGILNFPLTNWWALFIFLPAFGTLGTDWHIYQEEGRLTDPARITLLVGLVLTSIAFIFLFGISLTIVGPLLIILVGIAIILNYVIGNRG